jgi:hypothetical protein
MTADVVTMTGAPMTRERRRPEGRLHRCEIGSAEALARPIGEAFAMLVAGALKLKSFYGEDEAGRLIVAELDEAGIRLEVRS